MSAGDVPQQSYGVLLREEPAGELDSASEQIRRLGYAVIGSGLSVDQVHDVAQAFDMVHERYMEMYGVETLNALGEAQTLRALVSHATAPFLRLLMNARLAALLRSLFVGKFILNQQNGIINPAGQPYSQGAWHRDLPYQHFLSSVPLAINALYCVDNFTKENGSTFVLPASHKAESFPSSYFVQRNAFQIEAQAGDFIVLDAMAYHSGGFNASPNARRAVNHVFTIPYIRQQISLPAIMEGAKLTADEREVLGFGEREPRSIDEYLQSRHR